MDDRMDGLLDRLAAGAPLGDDDAAALALTTDILRLGMLADGARRRRHGASTTFVRVAELELPGPGPVPAIPPAAHSFTCVSGTAVNPGAFSSALYSVLTPIIAVNGDFRSVATKAGMSRGLVISRMCAPIFMNTRFTVSAKT